MFKDTREDRQVINLQSQGTCARGTEGTHVGNMILPPQPGFSDKDLFVGSSKKRKSTALTSSGFTSEFSMPHQSNLPEANPLLRFNTQGDNYGVHMNLSKSVEPVNMRNPSNNQFPHHNLLSETQPSFNVNPHENGIQKIGSASYNMISQSHSSNVLKAAPVVETCMMSGQQIGNVTNQTEACSTLPSVSKDTERPSVGPNLQELSSVLSNPRSWPLTMPLDSGSSECLRLVEILQQNSVRPDRFLDGLDGRACSQVEYSDGLRQSGFYSKVGAMSNPPNVEVASPCPSDRIEQDEKSGSTHNDGQFGRSPIGSANTSYSQNGSHGEENIKPKEMTVDPSSEKPKLALTKTESPGYRDNQVKTVGHGQNNNLNTDEKIKLSSEKASHLRAEKLWDGSLQLSSSVTLSAVAFFKSGEKLLGNNWPEFIEVKGKVRLEAFEKYIQDLPRSRNRGLMVISLCWKEGSSETGLAGMKEVAKGYKRSSRVGFAQFSSGIDLYICPRSDPIITILAKYGFFKGMAVIDDKPNSMIGCVVWRKNRTSSKPVDNKPDSKVSPNTVQLQNSPSSLSIKQDGEKELSPTKPSQEFSQHAQPVILPSSVNLENARESGSGSKNVVSGEVGHSVGNASTESSSLSNPDGSLSSNLVKKRPFDDDDLPEYDFGIALANSTSVSQPLNPPLPNNHGFASVTCQKLDSSSLAQLPSIVNQGNYSCSESQTPFSPVIEEKDALSRNTSKGLFEQSSKKTKLFDDDDDMPEWCPPELHNQIPPLSTNPNLHNITYPPRPPPIPPPPPADTRSAFSYQPFRPPISICPTSISPGAPPPPSLPVQRSSFGLNSSHASRHQPSSSNASPPFPLSSGRRPRP